MIIGLATDRFSADLMIKSEKRHMNPSNQYYPAVRIFFRESTNAIMVGIVESQGTHILASAGAPKPDGSQVFDVLGKFSIRNIWY